MNLFSFFGTKTTSACELAPVFTLTLTADLFIKSDVLSTYSKILTDTFERTHGLPEKYIPLMFDNCVRSEASEGLITLLARAMSDQADLFLVYSPSVNVLRKATPKEQEIIREDYKKQSKSSAGVFISFKNYRRTEMLVIYSGFEYCVLAQLNKLLNLSKAVQYKMANLRGSVALQDETMARAQVQAMATALGNGMDIFLDSEDEIALSSPDTQATEKAIVFLDAKRAYVLGLPISYVSGLQTPGIGSTGEADMRAVERGLKQYFVSILQPSIKSLLGVDTEFKSQDFRQINSALEAAKTFEIISDDYVSKEGKTEILRRLFELDEAKEEKALKAEALQAEEEPEEEEPAPAAEVPEEKA